MSRAAVEPASAEQQMSREKTTVDASWRVRILARLPQLPFRCKRNRTDVRCDNAAHSWCEFSRALSRRMSQRVRAGGRAGDPDTANRQLLHASTRFFRSAHNSGMLWLAAAET